MYAKAQLYSSCIRIMKNIESLRAVAKLIEGIEEIEEGYRGITNLLFLVADQIDNEIKKILDMCDPAIK